MKRSVAHFIVLGFALVAAGLGTARASWFSVNTNYGTNGVSAPFPTQSYSLSLAVDQNDPNYYVYSLVSAGPNVTNPSSSGPYSIARRTSTGALNATR